MEGKGQGGRSRPGLPVVRIKEIVIKEIELRSDSG
jgi:hypothetical protein